MTLNSVINLRNREMIYIRIYTLSFLNISKARQFYGTTPIRIKYSLNSL